LERVRQAARQRKGERFTALLHHVDEAALHAAYLGLKRDAAAGIDGVRWQDYERLIGFVEQRIGDRRIVRLIRKWVKAGVLEDGVLAESPEGTPQGAVISPLLAEHLPAPCHRPVGTPVASATPAAM
jgi:hypothetical protein